MKIWPNQHKWNVDIIRKLNYKYKFAENAFIWQLFAWEEEKETRDIKKWDNWDGKKQEKQWIKKK